MLEAHIAPLPPTAAKTQLALGLLSSQSKSLSKDLTLALNYIANANGGALNGWPTLPPTTKRLFPGRRKFFAKARKQAKPIEPDLAIKLYCNLVPETGTKKVPDRDLHLGTLILLDACGWGRANDLKHFDIKATMDSRRGSSFGLIYLKRKMHRYVCNTMVPVREGHTAIHTALQRWLRRFKLTFDAQSTRYRFFQSVDFRRKTTDTGYLSPVPMTYKKWSQCIVYALRRCNVPDPTSYSTHSFRVGGASAAYAENCERQAIKHFGLWKETATMENYVSALVIDATSPARRF